MEYTNIATKLISQLKEHGIEAYIWHTATTGSLYIRFEDQRMCSIRLGNHDGRGRLKYKFNLRADISPKHKQWIKDDNVWRFYLPMNKWKELIPVLLDRHKTIQTWPKKFNYTIPKYKLKEVEL